MNSKDAEKLGLFDEDIRICGRVAEKSPHRGLQCKIRGSHSGEAEDSGLLGYYAVATDRKLPTFRRIVAPFSSRLSSLSLHLFVIIH